MAIWEHDQSGWRLASPSGFPAEAALHELVEQAPHILPLAGDPRVVVVGKEVLLGANYADLIAVEPTGRLAIIEIKLARNAEARRAVVAQILTYAAYLRGTDPATLERDILGSHLKQRGYNSLVHAIEKNDQTGSFNAANFSAGLADSLCEGWFRLVLVLDEAPPELMRLVGYLGAVTEKLLIDLITVAAYDIGGSQVVVPQRVEAEQETAREPSVAKVHARPEGFLVEGKDDFVAAIDQAPADQQPRLRRLADWATALEDEGLATLWTSRGKSGLTSLQLHVPGEKASLVTIWNDNGAALTLWRSRFERRAPDSLARLEQRPDAPKIGQNTYTRVIPESLLDELTAAYREAAAGRLGLGGRPDALSDA